MGVKKLKFSKIEKNSNIVHEVQTKKVKNLIKK